MFGLQLSWRICRRNSVGDFPGEMSLRKCPGSVVENVAEGRNANRANFSESGYHCVSASFIQRGYKKVSSGGRVSSQRIMSMSHHV